VLGYGYWHARTHASVHIAVNDHAGRTARQLWESVKAAQIVVADAAGVALAEVTMSPPFGLPAYGGPGAVDCRAQERVGGAEWQRCFEAQSRWIAGWVPRAASARVTVGGCTVDRVAVQRRDYSDWWFWWVPLPHVGGTPYGYYTLELHIDSARCVPVTAP
jgi:hypothetical protein